MIVSRRNILFNQITLLCYISYEFEKYILLQHLQKKWSHKLTIVGHMEYKYIFISISSCKPIVCKLNKIVVLNLYSDFLIVVSKLLISKLAYIALVLH